MTRTQPQYRKYVGYILISMEALTAQSIPRKVSLTEMLIAKKLKIFIVSCQPGSHAVSFFLRPVPSVLI